MPRQCIPTIREAVLSDVLGAAEGECIMLGMPEFPSSSLRILSRSCYMGRTRSGGTGRGTGGRTRKGAREAPSVQNLREFVTPSRNTLAHVVEEIAKFPTGLLRHVSIPQRGCFPPPTPLFPPTLSVVCYAKILMHSLVQMSIPDISVPLVFFWALKYGHPDDK